MPRGVYPRKKRKVNPELLPIKTVSLKDLLTLLEEERVRHREACDVLHNQIRDHIGLS